METWWFDAETGLEVRQVVDEGEFVRVEVQVVSSGADCPVCGGQSHRVHSRYQRQIADLPVAGQIMRVRVTIRRFFCTHAACTRKIFAERLPAFAAVRGRSSLRLDEAHRRIGLALGGQAGSRLAGALNLPTSPDTVLRRIRRAPRPETPLPRVVGVDDWALRRGRRYGTIVGDLERRRPMALLPERSAESVRDWLKQHPQIEVVSRDRGNESIQGAGEGVPQAVQVADRWHLLKNLRDALTRVVARHQALVRRAAETAASPTADESTVPLEPQPADSTEAKPSSVAARQSLARRNRRVSLDEQVLERHRQSLSQRAIAVRVGLHRRTVRRDLIAGTFPERARRHVPRAIDPYVGHLQQRWQPGCRRAAVLFQELRSQGFKGSYDPVRRCAAPWRVTDSDSPAKPEHLPGRELPAVRRPSSWAVAWLLLRAEEDRDVAEQRFVSRLQELCPEIRAASALACEFADMLRERRADAWPDWSARGESPEAPWDLRRFANGLKSDEAAVKAALSSPWSNGQVEGPINKLKLLKRQMYGRAGFDLLQHRFLAVA